MMMLDWYKAVLALVIWREARGEPIEGKQAVANVIRNRVLATHLPDSWATIIQKPWQFSSLTAKNDPMLIQWPKDGDQTWFDSMNVAERTISGTGIDNTGGAINYANLSVCDPLWAHTMNFTVKIGHHSFFATGDSHASAAHVS